MKQISPKSTICCSLAAAVAMMVAATVVERGFGSEAALKYFYHNPVFFLLWGVIAILGIISLFKWKTGLAVKGIHIAFCTMLAGALTTHMTGNDSPAAAGTIISFTGYGLLLVSMIGFFFRKGSGFREALRRLMSVAVLAICFPALMSAAKSGDDYLPPVLPQEVAVEFDSLFVRYNGRVAPFTTMARDYCMKAYGKPSWNGCSATQVVTGWLFYYDWWEVVPFKLKAKDRGTEKEEEKEQIRMSAASGRAFTMFPLEFADSVVRGNPGLEKVMWFGCDDPLPENLDYNKWLFIRKSLDLIHDYVKAEDWENVTRVVRKIAKYQRDYAGEVLPSKSKVKAENFYNRISRPMIPSMASLTLGIVLFILFAVSLSKGRKESKAAVRVSVAADALLLVYLTVLIALRWTVSGHGPWDGSYAVMILMAWLASLSILLIHKRFSLILPFGFIIAGFTMLVASLSISDPQITALMPVLQTPLLSIHVLSMMVSYTLLGILAVNGVMGLCVKGSAAKEKLLDVGTVILYPAEFILIFGTFIGAVWAEIAWGAYWSWDPKETWALITLLIYEAGLHKKSLHSFSRPGTFHLFCVLAFISVLITYFGVNYFLGGVHSYA